MGKVQIYEDLLTKSYSEVVTYLLTKYGAAEDDYYRKSSYERFLNGKIKNIARGKYSRTNEGLYCHHIDEIKILNISNKEVILSEKIPFKYQKKERLVYCDLIEHTILHVLIAKETSEEYGLPGYLVYLKPIIEEWYIEEEIPNPKWMKNCYYKAYLTPEEALNILNMMHKSLGMNYVNSLREYREEKNRRIQKIKNKIAARKLEQAELDKNWQKKEEERKRLSLNKKTKEFYVNYPKYKELKIRFDTPRKKILTMLYESKYKNQYNTYNDFNKAMMPVVKDELLRELYSILDS